MPVALHTSLMASSETPIAFSQSSDNGSRKCDFGSLIKRFRLRPGFVAVLFERLDIDQYFDSGFQWLSERVGSIEFSEKIPRGHNSVHAARKAVLFGASFVNSSISLL